MPLSFAATLSSSSSRTSCTLPEFDAALHAQATWSLRDCIPASVVHTNSNSNSDDNDVITPQLVRHLTTLSLTLVESAADQQRLLRDVAGVVAWISQIVPVNVDAYQPMWSPWEVMPSCSASSATPSGPPLTLRLRDDAVNDGAYTSNLLRNAPYTHRDFFVVPKVLDQDE